MDTSRKQIKILIADDEKASREVLVNLLQTDGRIIRTAADGLQAQAILEADPCDLILSDLNMPHMGGMELLRFIREQLPAALVVIITGYATLESTLSAIEAGAYDYITKPFKLAEMEILVRNACDKILLTRERQSLSRSIGRKQEEIEGLEQRVTLLQNRLQQVEEREGTLFLGNLNLHRLPIAKESLAARYGQEESSAKKRARLVSLLREMRQRGEMSEAELNRFLLRFDNSPSASEE